MRGSLPGRTPGHWPPSALTTNVYRVDQRAAPFGLVAETEGPGLPTLALKPTVPPSPPGHTGHNARRPPASGACRKSVGNNVSRNARGGRGRTPGLTWVTLP